MAKTKHYEVDNVAKQVKAVIIKLTDAEQMEVDKFRHNGYEIIGVDKLKTEKRESLYTQEKVVAYLKSLGKQEYLDTYNKLYNEQALDKNKKPSYYLEDSKNGKHKKGEPKVKGHIGTLTWFKKTFENYPNK